MSRIFNQGTSWIVDRPWISIALLALITATSITGYIAPDLFEPAFAESNRERDDEIKDGESPPEVQQVALQNADAVIVAESDSFFTPQGSAAIRDIVVELEALPIVDDVVWLDNVPVINIFGLPEPLLPRESATASRFEAAKLKARNHPLVKGQFLSEDGKMMLLMVNFDYLMIGEETACSKLLDEAVAEVAAEHEEFECEFLVTGRVPFFDTATATHERNQVTYQLIGYSMIALMSVILFRGLTAVFVVGLAPALGVFWTLGIINLFRFGENPFIDVVLPILISLVGLTDGVHLVVQIRRNRVGGMSAFEAAKAGIRQVGLACGLTSLTTAIGFGSLGLAHHELVRDFGVACAIGVIITFVAVITVIPLACLSWLGRWVHVGHDKGLVDTNLNRISGVIDFVLKHSVVFSVLGILCTVALISISLTLKPDERQANAVPESSDVYVAIKKMDRAMGGLEYVTIYISWDQQIAEDAPQVLEAIRSTQEFLEEEPLIGHPMSIRNMLDALPGDGSDEDRMSMLELLPPPLKRAFYTPEHRRAKVVFRAQDLGTAKYAPIFERCEEYLTQLETRYPGFSFKMEGEPIWRWENLYQIVVDLATSLGTASLIIFFVLSLTYRSLRIGLISIIPNLFPLAVAGTYLVFSGQNLEVVMVCAFTCCLGIAVDDTIHFLTRYVEELKENDDARVAIRNAFTGVGTALIMTTIVLVAGFSTVLWSESRDHRIFASMGAITVAAALFGDLVFLPALLARFHRK